MTPDGPIKLVSDFLDLPLVDSEGRYCGVVDDLEFTGRVGGDLQVKALLVGPGAYAARLPRWAMSLVKVIAGEGITRVPWERIRTITDSVHLKCPGSELGLHRSEDAARRWIPKWGAW